MDSIQERTESPESFTVSAFNRAEEIKLSGRVIYIKQNIEVKCGIILIKINLLKDLNWGFKLILNCRVFLIDNL